MKDNNAQQEEKEGKVSNELYFAVSHNELEKVRKILEEGSCNINHTLVSGNTALHNAAKNGNAEMINLLLDAGANVNALTDHQWTPLHCAVLSNHTQAAKLLMKRGDVIDLNAKIKTGGTIMSISCYKKNIELVDYILTAGREGGLDLSVVTYGRRETCLGYVGSKDQELLQIFINHEQEPEYHQITPFFENHEYRKVQEYYRANSPVWKAKEEKRTKEEKEQEKLGQQSAYEKGYSTELGAPPSNSLLNTNNSSDSKNSDSSRSSEDRALDRKERFIGIQNNEDLIVSKSDKGKYVVSRTLFDQFTKNKEITRSVGYELNALNNFCTEYNKGPNKSNSNNLIRGLNSLGDKFKNLNQKQYDEQAYICYYHILDLSNNANNIKVIEGKLDSCLNIEEKQSQNQEQNEGKKSKPRKKPTLTAIESFENGSGDKCVTM